MNGCLIGSVVCLGMLGGCGFEMNRGRGDGL